MHRYVQVGRQYHETLPHLSSDGFNGGPPRKFETFYASLRRNGYHTMTYAVDGFWGGGRGVICSPYP
jgi:hypothetical protein